MLQDGQRPLVDQLMNEVMAFAQNPSSLRKRTPVALLALAGFAIASYLTAYQLGWVHTVWDPIFGAGSRRVLHSVVSRLLPVPDAALGALAYLVEFVLDLIGGDTRWRTQPRIVMLLGVVALCLGLGSVFLVFIQATVVHTFCTLCLASAVISWAALWAVHDEVRASVDAFLKLPSH